ncbi:ComF family protein [Alkaliphilus sp. MSJ-5]|uniref:ComF family protein n=1 Tax=Alkaliphilus flagellatus TaxID=2841507 RepID=A0ABS6G4N6_9FIRM|nr:ComF family protein [Alkaliphilus flagellatus]MBU5676652.1 ComF family protein [Alkaliphilus flagellatus]
MKILQVVEEYVDALLELIYPSKAICYMCNNSIEKEAKYSLCLNCYNAIPFIPDHYCIKCGIPLRMIEDGPNCEECKGSHHYFHRAISVVKYEEDIKKLIYRFKYSSQTYLARLMGSMMAHKLNQEGTAIDLILPVPLYKGKERERGFNQATLLCKYIAKETNIPINIDVLIRVKNTKVMHNLSKKERQENVNDAFKVLDEGVIMNKNILLVDDIFTTGATVNVCSRLLTTHGAKSVTVLTFARD